MSKRVLIIDDNVQLLRMITKIFQVWGYSVLSAETGEEGLKLAQRKRPDLVILDVGLPDMNGFKVCEILKTEKKTEGIKILMLTGKTQIKDVEQGFQVSADGYLLKPFNPERMLEKVKQLI
ncbi:PleD family two-component system response regulator [Elusimicrobiota bacterium]